jgi:cytochrome c oxidase subunit 2
MWNFRLFPEQASTIGGRVDAIFFFVTGLALLFAVPVATLIVYFAIRYRRGARVERLRTVHEGRGAASTWLLEGAWIAIPFFLSLGVFTWGARIFVDMMNLPPNGQDVYVVGKQWMWKFQHPTGQTEINVLHVPVGRPVRLTMISQDVIHSFYVPAFRIKRDVLPGEYTTMWFEATETGEYHLFCAEYCGAEHSRMGGSVVVLEPAQYQQWLSERGVGGGTGAVPEEQTTGLAGTGAQTMADAGAQLFQSIGCDACHRMDGSGAGPSLVGVFGSTVELDSGQTIEADAQYIRTSILDPNAHVVAGYPPIMPTYEGQLDEEQILLLVEYVRSLAAGELSEGDQEGEQE